MIKKFDLEDIPPAPDFQFEEKIWSQGYLYIVGVDEAGRGALAGPVAAAALMFAPEPRIAEQLIGVRDSKEMNPRSRAEWATRLQELALDFGVGYAEAREIDSIGIVPATHLAVRRALKKLQYRAQHILIDYIDLPGAACPVTSIVKGDARSLSIAAASILAKHSRDEVLREFEQAYPGYGFAKHKGYGTRAHHAALCRLGPTPIHRRSFKPLRPD
jgi:ribonuclease HII